MYNMTDKHPYLNMSIGEYFSKLHEPSFDVNDGSSSVCDPRYSTDLVDVLRNYFTTGVLPKSTTNYYDFDLDAERYDNLNFDAPLPDDFDYEDFTCIDDTRELLDTAKRNYEYYHARARDVRAQNNTHNKPVDNSVDNSARHTKGKAPETL